MDKTLGVLIILSALVIGILPVFTDCQSQGRELTLQNGTNVPMKCHWMGIAEIAIAVPLALAGGWNVVTKQKDNQRLLAIFGMLLGAFAILFPTALIGVCANPSMLCNMIMRPGLILSGIVAIGASLGILLNSPRTILEPAL
jgi:hypothetical protein